MATDLCFWTTFVAVAMGFGGRMASGQLALVIGAPVTAACWMMFLLVSSKSRYEWTGAEWVWLTGILVAVAQLVPLPESLLLKLSPQLKSVLPLWFDHNLSEVSIGNWNQLSLNPWETASGLVTFLCYLMLFLVVAQRVRHVRDAELYLCLVSVAAVAMMLFAQMQYLTSNTKFFWVYEHPYMSTESYPLGCFTNRNHLAQFLALGVAPLIWWLLRRLQQQELDRVNRSAIPDLWHWSSVLLILAALAGIALTVLMTLSRGGLVAIALTSFVSVALMCRIGLASFKFVIGLVMVGALTSCLFSYLGHESILAARLKQNSGRMEIWEANIKVAQQFPVLGTGIGTHVDAHHLQIGTRDQEGQEYTHAESGYLQIASESGIAGLIATALFILTSLWWCGGALWSFDKRIASVAAATMGSLIGNIAHAVGDFFWYTPVCVLLLAVQLACAARLYRFTRQERGRVSLSVPLPRLIVAMSLLAMLPISGWMISLKYPAFLAEPHHVESLLLARIDQRDLTEEERLAIAQQRIKETILAAKYEPRNATYQEAAAKGYLQLFDLKQESSENTMSADMIRDAVIGSQFETMDATTEWLNRAVGSNLKLLKLAARAARRSLANCPLRAKSCVLMAEVSFVERKYDDEFNRRLLEQAQRLRPSDPDILYLVGKSALLKGDIEKALHYWRPSFTHSLKNRERISDVLAVEMTPEFFIEQFHPDWKAFNVIANSFERAGRPDESRQMRCEYIRQGAAKARSIKSDDEYEIEMTSLRNACRSIGDIAASAMVLSRAVKRLPQSYSMHYMLGLDLTESGQTAEAAEHFKWCATRKPNDENLQKMASQSIVEQLKRTPTATHRDESLQPASYQR